MMHPHIFENTSKSNYIFNFKRIHKLIQVDSFTKMHATDCQHKLIFLDWNTPSQKSR